MTIMGNFSVSSSVSFIFFFVLFYVIFIFSFLRLVLSNYYYYNLNFLTSNSVIVGSGYFNVFYIVFFFNFFSFLFLKKFSQSITNTLNLNIPVTITYYTVFFLTFFFLSKKAISGLNGFVGNDYFIFFLNFIYLFFFFFNNWFMSFFLIELLTVLFIGVLSNGLNSDRGVIFLYSLVSSMSSICIIYSFFFFFIGSTKVSFVLFFFSLNFKVGLLPCGFIFYYFYNSFSKYSLFLYFIYFYNIFFILFYFICRDVFSFYVSECVLFTYWTSVISILNLFFMFLNTGRGVSTFLAYNTFCSSFIFYLFLLS